MLKNFLGEAMNEKFDLQEYLTKGVERIVGEAVRATLKNPRESAFMLKFAAASCSASKRRRKDFDKADIEKRGILSLYRSEILKISRKYRSKVLTIFDQIPGLLSRHEKRVVFNDISAGSKADQYEETFFWLSDSMISNECFRCKDH